MAFDKKAWMRDYMRAYRRGKRRKPRPGYFDKKAWSRSYMREYMRKVRARQKLERERDEAIDAAMARLSNPAPWRRRWLRLVRAQASVWRAPSACTRACKN